MTRLSRKYGWLSRYAYAFMVGFGSGMAIPVTTHSYILKQLYSAVAPFQDAIAKTAAGAPAPTGWEVMLTVILPVFGAVVVMVGTVAVLFYFFFSVEHKRAGNAVSRRRASSSSWSPSAPRSATPSWAACPSSSAASSSSSSTGSRSRCSDQGDCPAVGDCPHCCCALAPRTWTKRRDGRSRRSVMKLLYKPDWDETKERFKAWWAHEYFGRCAFAVTAPKKHAPETPEPARPATPELRWTDLDYISAKSDWENSRTFFGGEAFPGWGYGYPGHAWIPAFLGSPVDARLGHGLERPHPDRRRTRLAVAPHRRGRAALPLAHRAG